MCIVVLLKVSVGMLLFFCSDFRFSFYCLMMDCSCVFWLRCCWVMLWLVSSVFRLC